MEEELNINNEETTISAEESSGNVKISVDVVATIASVAAAECSGVYGMAGSFAGELVEKFGARKNPNKGVKVDISENIALVDLFIVVKYGVRIPELAWEIQEKVKNNIESMTGMVVAKVNIHIEGINFDNDKEQDEEEAEKAEETVEAE